MKAIQYARYGGPEVLEFVEIADPVPADDEVLIAVHAAAVAPGDWKVRAGRLQQMFPLELPTVPGRDGAGVVIACGADVDWARVGDEVCFVALHTENGGAAELIARQRHRVAFKPANISFAEAAALTHGGICAWIALVDSGGLRSGQKVLIHGGSGGIGSIAVQIARHCGAYVVASCHSSNVDYVCALGAHRVIAYDREDFSRIPDRFDLVLDLVGGDTHRRSYEVMAQGARMVWLIAKPIEDLSAEFGVETVQAVIDDRIEALQGVLDLAASGAVKPQIGRCLALAECAEAHQLLETGARIRGRIVLDVQATASRS